MLPHPLTNFKIQKFYQNEPEFNGVYSRTNLPKIKDGEWVVNIDEYKSIETDWIAMYVITKEHLTMQYISIALDLNIFQKKFKNS